MRKCLFGEVAVDLVVSCREVATSSVVKGVTTRKAYSTIVNELHVFVNEATIVCRDSDIAVFSYQRSINKTNIFINTA